MPGKTKGKPKKIRSLSAAPTSRRTPAKPAWQGFQHDLSEYRLSPEEMARRHQLRTTPIAMTKIEAIWEKSNPRDENDLELFNKAPLAAKLSAVPSPSKTARTASAAAVTVAPPRRKTTEYFGGELEMDDAVAELEKTMASLSESLVAHRVAERTMNEQEKEQEQGEAEKQPARELTDLKIFENSRTMKKFLAYVSPNGKETGNQKKDSIDEDSIDEDEEDDVEVVHRPAARALDALDIVMPIATATVHTAKAAAVPLKTAPLATTTVLSSLSSSTASSVSTVVNLREAREADFISASQPITAAASGASTTISMYTKPAPIQPASPPKQRVTAPVRKAAVAAAVTPAAAVVAAPAVPVTSPVSAKPSGVRAPSPASARNNNNSHVSASASASGKVLESDTDKLLQLCDGLEAQLHEFEVKYGKKSDRKPLTRKLGLFGLTEALAGTLSTVMGYLFDTAARFDGLNTAHYESQRLLGDMAMKLRGLEEALANEKTGNVAMEARAMAREHEIRSEVDGLRREIAELRASHNTNAVSEVLAALNSSRYDAVFGGLPFTDATTTQNLSQVGSGKKQQSSAKKQQQQTPVAALNDPPAYDAVHSVRPYLGNIPLTTETQEWETGVPRTLPPPPPMHAPGFVGVALPRGNTPAQIEDFEAVALGQAHGAGSLSLPLSSSGTPLGSKIVLKSAPELRVNTPKTMLAGSFSTTPAPRVVGGLGKKQLHAESAMMDTPGQMLPQTPDDYAGALESETESRRSAASSRLVTPRGGLARGKKVDTSEVLDTSFGSAASSSYGRLGKFPLLEDTMAASSTEFKMLKVVMPAVPSN